LTADPLETPEPEYKNKAAGEATSPEVPLAEAAVAPYADADVAEVAAPATPPVTPPAADPVTIADPAPESSAQAWAALYAEASAEPITIAGPAPEPDHETTDTAVSEVIAELAGTLPEPLGDAAPAEQPVRRSWFRRSWFRRSWFRRSWFRPSPPIRRFLGFAAAFIVSALLGLFLVSAVAMGFSASYANRVLPGVHVGSVDLSGLTRDQAIARLQSEFSYLGKGEVTITTPVGAATITYQQVGRGPDAQVMADAAMSVGHSGWLVPDAAAMVHSAVYGQAIPLVVRLDPMALAQRIRQLVGTSTIEPQNAQATATAGAFGVMPATSGNGLDENSIGSAVLDQLAETGAPADLQAGGAFLTVKPQITDKDAQKAIDEANKMSVDVGLTWKVPPPNAPASWKPSKWTISAKQIREWIVFGVRPDGSYAPDVDPVRLQAYVANLTTGAGVAAVEPRVKFDSAGKMVDLVAPQDGAVVDVGATASAIETHLDALAGGVLTGPDVEIVTTALHPQLVSLDAMSSMILIGSHTTTFYPDISNGIGKNIRQPATNLDGMVIGPGQHFSFLDAVGPIDAAHGYAMGGVILHGQSDHTGAMGGGICSASTTMFNAAANAGLQIDERHAHFYYITRYPSGRDATVYSNGQTTWDLRWTNDTPYPIVIHAWTTPGSKSTITIQIWSWPTNRTVSWTGGVATDKVKAGQNPPIYTNTLPTGTKATAEYPTDGFNTAVERIVKDASGTVIHDDKWGSSYAVVNGQILIGGPAPVAPTPVPTATPVGP
jgi:vancomycin resistance protein YoaR